MHETCTKAVKGMPQCKNSLANCANSRAVAGMSITGWKQGCNMAVTGCLLRNIELNMTGLFQGCYSVDSKANPANLNGIIQLFLSLIINI